AGSASSRAARSLPLLVIVVAFPGADSGGMQRYHISLSARRQKFVKNIAVAVAVRRRRRGTGAGPPCRQGGGAEGLFSGHSGRRNRVANFIARPMSPLTLSFPLMKAAVGSIWPIAILT